MTIFVSLSTIQPIIMEEWKYVEEIFGGLCVIVIVAHMMLMSSVGCLDTTMAVSV